MKNFEIVEKIPNNCRYRGSSVLTIAYKESLTIIDPERQERKPNSYKFYPAYNHPKNSPVLINGFESVINTPPAHKLSIPSRHTKHQTTTQLFNTKKPYVMVVDGKIYELYGDNYRKENGDIGTSFVINKVDGETNTDIKVMNLLELEEYLFPIFKRKAVLIMDLDGNIFQKPDALIPDTNSLREIYEKYLNDSKEQIKLLSKIIKTSKNNAIETNYQEPDLPQDIFYDVNKGVSLFNNLLYVEGISRDDFKISLLDVDLLNDNKFLVRTYAIPVVKYTPEALAFLQKINQAPVKRFYKK